MFEFKKNILVIMLLFISTVLFADDILNVFLNKREVELGKLLTLTVEISNDIENLDKFELPKMPDFIVLPKKNYKKGNKNIYTYDITPKNIGFFSIPSIVVYDKDKEIMSEPINVKVVKYLQSKKSSYTNKSNENIFVEAYIDINSIYVNQQIYYTLKFSTKFDLASNPTYFLPMFKDFWKSESNTKSGYKLIDGENYFVFEVITKLYPMRDGNVIIDPSNVKVEYLKYDDVDNNEFNKILNAKKIKYSLNSNPVTVRVFPLPEIGKPENFTGAVGKYSIVASVDKKSVVINEPISLTVQIEGNGNINAISEPEIKLPTDMKKYATSVYTKSKGFTNSKRFKSVIIPLIEGEKTIPGVYFSYFDPDSKEYVNIKTDDIKVNISSGVYVKDIEVKQSDVDTQNIDKSIQPIKSDIKLKQYHHMLIKNKMFVFILIPFFMFLIYSLVYRIMVLYMQRDIVKLQKKAGYKKSLKYLHEAYKSMQEENQEKFYFNINLSIRIFLQSCTNSDYINMIKEEIKSNLNKFQISESLVIDIEKILIDCELFQFSYIKTTKLQMEDTYRNTKYIIEELDKVL
ncbi:MAG: BatD family protein [Endomicrobiia bacterium]|nr:BatD family protein [Endomicrobiaceae bacterium]MDD3922591.1 BatD family protein [Endomicrobiaceae bacterium]MDD5102267.1 BatD family protein [Endomicrobiaceae bacterium]